MFSLLQNVAGVCCKLLALRVLGADAVRDLFARLCEYRYFAVFFKLTPSVLFQQVTEEAAGCIFAHAST